MEMLSWQQNDVWNDKLFIADITTIMSFLSTFGLDLVGHEYDVLWSVVNLSNKCIFPVILQVNRWNEIVSDAQHAMHFFNQHSLKVIYPNSNC